MYNKVKTPREITAIRESGRQLATVLEYLKTQVRAGLSTKDLADFARQKLAELGGKPAFLGYYGFPDVLCVSVNDEVVHGIPSADKILRQGDIVSMDFGVIVDGMITDAAISVVVGTTGNTKDKELLRFTEEALLAGIAEVRDGVRVGDIANAIETVLNKHQLGNVRDLVGHGVGHELHEEPNIPNYGRVGSGPMLRAGMTIAIEPMATLGGHEVFCEQDGWTIKTSDASRSAHFEHTILITEHGSDILTAL